MHSAFLWTTCCIVACSLALSRSSELNLGGAGVDLVFDPVRTNGFHIQTLERAI